MRVLIIDIEEQGLDFALRCAAADHDVRLFIYTDPGKKTRIGEGFKGIKIVPDWQSHMAWAREGLILVTGNYRFMRDLDRYRDLGYKIFGPTAASAALEIDRAKGMEAMKAVGIPTPPYHTFPSLQQAQAFARKSDDCFVFKTLGSEGDKSLSFVSGSPAEMVGWIQNKIDRGMSLKGPCMLQEKVDMLCEFGVSGWFGPEGFLAGKWQENVEHKKLMNGEIGPQTGEMCNVAVYAETSRIADDMLMPMAPILATLGHRGDFAIGVGIDTKGRAWPFEFTARCGWPAWHIQVASAKGDPARWMRDLLDGKDTLEVDRRVSIGVVMGQPRFPYQSSPPDMVEGNPVTIDDTILDDLHFCSVMMGKTPVMKDGKVVDRMGYQTAGEYVLVATGLGATVQKARKAVYGAVDGVKFPNSIYRTDAGEKLEAPLPLLHKHGFAMGMTYE